MYERILAPTDGSDSALRATKCAVELGAACDAAVEVLHVGSDLQETSSDDVLANAEALATQVGHPVTTHLAAGKPHEQIAAHVAERGTDLVVMGRHGRHGLRERLLGSVTDRVLRTTDVPVLTVGGVGVTDDLGTVYDDVLLPTDGSENAIAAAPYAAHFAALFDATLHVVSVVDIQRAGGVFDAGGVDEAFVERLESRGEDAISEGVESATETAPDVDVQRAVLRGHPAETLCEYVDGHDVDLVAMGSEGASNLAGQLLGSVTNRVLRTTDVPVLVVGSN